MVELKATEQWYVIHRSSRMLARVPVSSHFGSASPFQHINPVAASLIQKMLQTDPTARPTIHELLNDEFFTSGYIPARLPITCLTIPPRFSIAPSSLDPSNRKPLTVLNKGKDQSGQKRAQVSRVHFRVWVPYCLIPPLGPSALCPWQEKPTESIYLKST